VKTIEKTTTHTQEKLTKLTTMSGQGESTTQFSMPSPLDDEKSIQFFYTNVLIPIGAGALVALFIAFLVVLCRCCRRRKLKKVRYFGKAHGEMYMDKLNLLADSSDEE